MSEATLFETSPSLRRPCVFSILCALVLLLARYLSHFDDAIGVLLTVLLAIVAVRFVTVFIQHSFVRYRITDNFVEIREGIISHKIRRTPWTRITNFTQEQSLLERILGLSTVFVDMPGHEELEIEFRDLTTSDAEQIMVLFEEYMPEAREEVAPHAVAAKA